MRAETIRSSGIIEMKERSKEVTKKEKDNAEAQRTRKFAESTAIQ